MQMTIETVDPAAPTIYVRRGMASVSDLALAILREITSSAGRDSDCLRTWLRGVVDAEIARRYSEDGELEEPGVLNLPWHSWDDNQLRHALAATFSWCGMSTTVEVNAILMEVHRAVVTACCTRLGELHEAIELSKKRATSC